MRKTILLLAALALALAPAVASAQSLSATLSGANVVGGGDSDGSGFAALTFAGTQLTYTILVSNVSAPTAAHIHQGAAGVDGGVVVNFDPTFVGGAATGTVTDLDSNEVAAILANPSGYYVNVHNADFTGGAIRGQLLAAGGASAQTTLYAPVLSKVAGQLGTNFLSDLVLGNPNTDDVDVTVDYYATPGGATPTATETVTVPAGGQLLVADALDELFAATGRGAAVLSGPMTFMGHARVYNDQRGTAFALPGTFSQFSQLLPMSEAKSSGVLLGLSNQALNPGNPEGYRTNLGFFNPNSTGVAVQVSAFSASGTLLGTKSVALAAHANDIQSVFALIDTVTSTNQDDFFVRFTTTGGNIFMFASMVDNITGDAVYITPQSGM